MKYFWQCARTALQIYVSAMVMLAWTLSASMAAQVDTDKPADQVASPYLETQSKDPPRDRLPPKNTQADVRMLAVIADVAVTKQ